MNRFIQSLQSQSIEEYLEFYPPDLRKGERASLKSLFDDFGMDRISAASISLQRDGENQAVSHLRVNFRNEFSVIMEVWKLELALDENGWMVVDKQAMGNTQTLYSILLPSDRVERVKAVIIQHSDIRFYFEDALVFYDNIPGLETAFLIMGQGGMNFEPSLEREQHQLDLVYGDPYLEEDIEYVFARCSPSFFTKNITIVPYSRGLEVSVSEEERKKVSSLFARHYPRSFTVESPWLDSRLSVLPQGREAVFDFKTRKKGVFSYIYSPFSDEEINLYEWKETRLICLYSPPFEGNKKRMFISFGQKFDVHDVQLKLTYRPKEYLFSGSADIKLESLVGSLGVVKFKLNPDLSVLRILDEDENDLYYTWDRLRKTIYIYFLRNIPRGKSGRIRIFYRGNIPPPPVNTDVVGFNYGQDIDRFPSEYRTYLYSRQAFWYPAPSLDDYFTAGFTLSIDQEYDVISSGERMSAGSQDDFGIKDPGMVTTRFESRNPVKYISFIAGRFREMDRKSDPLPITYFHALRARSDQWNVLEEAGKILSFYESRFGEYPFRKFSLIKRAWASGGGYSPPGYIVINELPRGGRFRLRLQSRSPVDFSQWQEYFLAHEIAHQWWGQGLSWKSYSDQWISEGLSQFSASLYLRNKYGPDSFSQIIKKFSSWTRKKSHWGGITMGSRISHFDFEAYQAIVYNKAALVLHLLKDYVGEELFFMGLQKFFSRNKYSPAGTSGFRKIFHDITGLDLDDFFEPWFESYRLPQVEIRKSVQKTPEGFEMHIDLKQNGLRFIFPLWVQWKEGGRKMRKKVVVDEKIERYIIPVEEKPKNIKINPDNAVPGKFR